MLLRLQRHMLLYYLSIYELSQSWQSFGVTAAQSFRARVVSFPGKLALAFEFNTHLASSFVLVSQPQLSLHIQQIAMCLNLRLVNYMANSQKPYTFHFSFLLPFSILSLHSCLGPQKPQTIPVFTITTPARLN